MEKKSYYLGLDIGTDSVGYAAASKDYSLLRYKGKHVWGVTLFDEAQLNDERRALRTSRRSLGRRKWRVSLVQELFAEEIRKVDPKFYIRIQESALWREDAQDPYCLFNDDGYTDKEYHQEYPTIHHLITDLMTSDKPHDVRLVYQACAWLVAHRGHFLSDISKENVGELTDFMTVYKSLTDFICMQGPEFVIPWDESKLDKFADILQRKITITAKYKALSGLLFNGASIKKLMVGSFGVEALIKLLCGASVKVKDLYPDQGYDDAGSISLGMKEEDFIGLIAQLGDDAELILRLKAIYDWSLLVGVINGEKYISEAKVKVYEQHKVDLTVLKAFVKKYMPEYYNELFRRCKEDNYQAYVYHTTKKNQPLPDKKADKVIFSDALKKKLKTIVPQDEDRAFYDDMMARLDTYSFLPKQKNGDNRVVPYQLYWIELKTILDKASAYLPFLNEKDADGLSVRDKLMSVFEFRVPYFVGPLKNTSDNNAWISRRPDRICPWNFEKMVDLDACERSFIDQMLNRCTYLPDQFVLPKESLLYHKFTVLNEINNIKVDGTLITPEMKQHIYLALFMNRRKVSVKQLKDFMIANGYMTKEQTLSGIDEQIKSDMKPWLDFKRLMDNKALTEEQVEDIIRKITYTEDKARLKKYISKEYPGLNAADLDYVCRLNYKDFGKLSAKLLTGFEGTDRSTGEVLTIMQAMWETNENFMELMSERYSFADDIKQAQQDWYMTHPMTLDERLEDMWVSNAVKRPIIQALKIVREVVKAEGCPPEKIFVEVTRGASEEQKNKRTVSRKDQILALYDKCRNEDVRILRQQLEAMGEMADSRLRADALFLYYMQLGRCMYTGEPIPIEQIKSSAYNIDHIYPQSYVTDDSILNNRVLVKSEINGQKTNNYPIAAEIRHSQRDFWALLHNIGMINDEKYRRLTRCTPFTDEEKLNFIARQLTQTSQSVKVVAELLKEMYPDTKIVYTKARLTSDFRHEFDLVKSRTFNDLHHAKDAYLNIVTGNVYDMKFSSRWFSVHDEYSVKPRTLFTHPVICGKETVWDGTDMLERAKKTCALNDAHMTCYSFCRHGGLFDRQPKKAAEGLISRKKNLPSEKYGGYQRPSASYFMLAKFMIGKKVDMMVIPVLRLEGDNALSSIDNAKEYAKRRIMEILGKKVDSVELPLGLRRLKINTMLELDGFRVCIAGKSGGEKRLIVVPYSPFVATREIETYVKHLEKLVENVKKDNHFVFDSKYDKVDKESNLRLYDLYVQKLQGSIFQKRVNSPLDTLLEGRETFVGLTEIEQAKALHNIHQVFSRVSRGVDLTLIRGTSRAATTENFSALISNWHYADVRIVDASASGLWEQKSVNLKELL